MKVALCAIIKNENKYIKEWIEHYKNIGFDKIILGDNNDDNGENINNVIYEFGDFIIVKDVKNTPMTVKVQENFYSNSYNEYSNEFDYIAFFDADEYLILNKWKNIDEMVSDKVFTNFDGITISWDTYSDNDIIENKTNSIKCFTKKVTNIKSKNHIRIKTIYKTNVKNAFNNIGIHCCNKEINICNVLGQKVKYSKYPYYYKIIKNAWLNHYKYRSFNDFLEKLKKFKQDKPHVDQLIYDYFTDNKKTTFKVNKIKEILKN